LPVFQGATTYPAIVRVSRAEANETFSAAQIATLDYSNVTLDEYIAAGKFNVNQTALDNGGWSLTDETSQALLDKLRKVGVPLGKYVDKKIYYGIKTGLNEAFVIDEATKDRLIAEDARSEEIIKPFLAGRDIKRYEKPKVKNYLILMPKGWTSARLKTNDAKTIVGAGLVPARAVVDDAAERARTSLAPTKNLLHGFLPLIPRLPCISRRLPKPPKNAATKASFGGNFALAIIMMSLKSRN